MDAFHRISHTLPIKMLDTKRNYLHPSILKPLDMKDTFWSR